VGVEVEYMVVDSQTLSVLPVVDRVLEGMAGAIVSEVEWGSLAFSNELVLHVLELKTNGPATSFHGLDVSFQAGVARANEQLGPLGGVLLPTAMHPWMDPESETTLWPHEFSPVYETFDRVFGCTGHGWSNLQSTHLNLPFADDGEFGCLHAAMRVVLPLIPGLAASSPLVEGRPTGFLDNRMEMYRMNSRRIPSVAGQIIPEPMFTQVDYEREILGRMYADIAPHDPERILQDEFLNARGAIPRFGRGSIELRVMDVQEAPVADLAMAELASGAVRLLVEEELSSRSLQEGLGVSDLAPVFLHSLKEGERFVVDHPRYLEALGFPGRRASVQDLWWHLLETVAGHDLLLGEASQSTLEGLLKRGPLAREILRALDLSQSGSATPPSREALREVYGALALCLREGVTFHV
jgi:gamma-glutamyl:cysteine ligase YbdK (ATP-grasp superfamily)